LPTDLSGRGQMSALFSMAYLALKARGARDWRTGLGLSLTHQGRLHFIEHHQIFPKTLLKKSNYNPGEINEIANMAFVSGGTNRSLSSRPAEQYLKEVLQDQGEEALKQHCIPLDPGLWTVDAYGKFLEYRRAALATAINEFIVTVDGPSDTIDVESLITQEEGEELEFKSSARWDYRENRTNKVVEAMVEKTIAGLLNGKGGILVIGVDDQGQVLGLEPDYKSLGRRQDRDGYQQFLINLISQALGRDVCASVSISFHLLNGGEVCALRVSPSPNPVYVQDRQQSKFYLGTGNTTQELGTRESVSYIKTRWG